METKKNLKAALYIRVSTEEQAIDGQSASAQEETLKQYCRAFGIEVFDVFMDLGLSGKSLKHRNALKRLIEACSSGKFDLVLVWKISRLSRNLKDLLYLIDLFETHNVHFTSCSEKFDTSTPVGRMTLQLLGSIAEFERNTIIENVKLGLKEFARKGGKSSAVFGYDNTDKMLLVNEGEAKVVKLIFHLYAEGDLNFSAIARYINSLGYRTKRGSEFRSSSISYILHNPVYTGINRHGMNTVNEYSVQGAHLPIIDPELWSKAQSKDHRHINKKSGCSPNSSIFRVTCMKCGNTMKIFHSYSKGKKYIYYRCCSCSNYINAERLMKAAAQKFIALLSDKASQKYIYSLIKQNTRAYEEKNIEIASLESEISRLKKSKSRYLNLFESYKITESKAFMDRITEIENQIEALEKKKLSIGRAALVSGEAADYEKYLAELKAGLEALEPAVLKQLSACLIKSIVVYRGEIDFVLYL